MKMTLLEIVQDILNDMDSDEVNSISDSVESAQVVSIIKDAYYDLINTRAWPQNYKLSTLEGVADADRPSHLKLPENVSEIEFIKYNVKESGSDDLYRKMEYLTPDEFIDHVILRNSSDSNVQVVTQSEVKLNILNDQHPTYWTSFDDEYVIFDSFHSTYDTVLQQSKSLIHCLFEPSWTVSDSFIPDMPSKAFPLLLSTAKNACFIKLKQVSDPVEQDRARRHKTYLANNKWRHKKGTTNYPNYGRK